MSDFEKRMAALSSEQLEQLKERLAAEGIDLQADLKGKKAQVYLPLGPVEKKEYYPLSSVQKRLFTLEQLGGSGTVYQLTATHTVTGDLDIDKVKQVMQAIVGRHESFRTSFQVIDGEPQQRIWPKVKLEIESFDCPDQAFPFDRFIRPFNLASAPLLRVSACCLRGDKFIIVIDMHHIVSDALSKRILWEEFDRLYRGEVLPEPPLQYKDFSTWQNTREVQKKLLAQEEYWLKEFSGPIPLINLPLDFDRPKIKNYAGRYRLFKIDRQKTAALKSLAARENATLFSLVLALYNVFLAKVSGQADIVAGVPIAGRRQPELAGVIGMFVNTLALRNYPLGDMSFTGFLREVRQKTLQAFDHQDYPFEDLVNRVIKNRDTSRNPLFDVFFSFRGPGVSFELPSDWIDADREGGGLPGDNLPKGDTLSMFDLYFLGADIDGELLLVLVYASALFKAQTIDRFIRYIKDIMVAVADRPGIKLKDIRVSHDLAPARALPLPGDGEDFDF